MACVVASLWHINWRYATLQDAWNNHERGRMAARTVIFDLDGTLADTSGDLIAAANACFQGLGLGDKLDDKDVFTAFAGGRAMLRLGFSRGHLAWSERDVDTQYPVLLAAYATQIDRQTRIYPGVEAALAELAALDWRMGICTNKPEGLAETLMQRLGLRRYFGALIGADTLPVRKPDPAPYREAVRRVGGLLARSVLVGDTVNDRDTARAAGVPVILVTFGPSGQAVEALSPDGLLHNYADLPRLLDQLVGPD